MVFALESVRNRLAIAIASETKSTPPDRYRYYLETADRARRFVKWLRRIDFDLRHERNDWILALEALRKAPAQGEALELCRMLHDVVIGLGSEME